MKKKIFIPFLFIVQICFSQSGIVTYKAESLIVAKNNSNQPELLKKEIDLMSFTLKYNKYTSFFKKEKNIPLNKMNHTMASILIKSFENWFQNASLKETAYNKQIGTKMYIVKNNRLMEDWNLTNEVKIIDGYTCYKAEKKLFYERSQVYKYITAWYTPDIPVPFGPIGSGNLPGLILQLKFSGRAVYTVSKIILNPKKKVKIPILKKGEKISVKEMLRLAREARKVTVD